ncbi:MAG: acyl-CoA dehydratase activase [Candidatus Desulfaltia sp.]|nr:acyl-CoA dehydratase activase [Candidatus Desulfaltia sp.]
MGGNINSLGICLGASTVSLVWMELEQGRDGENKTKPRVVKYLLHSHEGNPKQTLLSALESLDINSYDRIAVTGRRFRNLVKLSSISEPEAVEYAYGFVKPADIACPAVVSAGGETFMVYALDGQGQISNVLTGNKCASGTGEFFLQQLRRMKVTLEEAARWAAAEEPYQLSGRCSVFCKSDCTHATNKGIPKSKVTAGLCKMMAEKILELLKKVQRENIMITGGTALNQMMIEYLRKDIAGIIVPKEAPYFEALGAALWALENETAEFPGMSDLLRTEVTSFDTLMPLMDFKEMVEFKTVEMGDVRQGDECILGLDVGSTTTKAILLRIDDNAMLASVYLRTDGDPVEASRKCYDSILKQISKKVNPDEISITGLGVTGSGRQIAGLHALTKGIINEIIAHATAAVYFDPKVDTIFEIGGQDAKYTYITNAVPSDYAMNEACSAGTGSFLEESAYETLGVKMEDIGDIAFQGKCPPNFNDQCAAFIASDIKNAIHEGVKHEDIVAGLVYSICMNYSNRVKGNKPIGEKVFMQGGVCYNRAVPFAMAALVGKPIVVPPEPGLMGAFGVALEVKKRIKTGLIEKKIFDLEAMLKREVKYGKPFICKGGKEKCDRRCNIALIKLEGKKYPFGGACNRYYNLRNKVKHDVEKLDLVRVRQQLIFDKYGGKLSEDGRKKQRGRIGINRSFLVNTFYPLYSTFFTQLGFEPVVPDFPFKEGTDQKEAAFCYPAELAHGFFYALIYMDNPPEFIFLPQFKAVPAQNGYASSQVCPFVQGETFYLGATFRGKLDELKSRGTEVLTPLLDLTEGLETAEKPLVETALKMGVGRKEAGKAFEKALKKQMECIAEMKKIGNKAIEELEKDPDKTAVVIFARPYNGFVKEAHMGIPNKLASRGVLVMPFDFLTFDDEKTKRHMYWGIGQTILKAARVVKNHPQLFGTYITNFSCGPDSFIVGYFRSLMGQKPSLTLELDSHTADAGIETRVEAFLDIVATYRQLLEENMISQKERAFVPAKLEFGKGKFDLITSSGEVLPVGDPRVTFLLPSMGRISSESLAAVFRSLGFNAIAHPPSDEAVLKLGRANSSCKECLPLILTTGTLLNYIYNIKKENEVLIYFMPTGSGPCRFGQYYIFMEDLVKRLELPDVAMFSLTSENSYAGLGKDFQLRAWCAIVISDVMEDIRSMILANATDTEDGTRIFNEEWNLILEKIERGNFSKLEKQLVHTSERFSRISVKLPSKDVPVICIIGEIFVRRDSISRQYLTRRLAKSGFATICSPVAEWILYSDYIMGKGLTEHKMSKMDKLEFIIKQKYMVKYEKLIKSILSGSGLVCAEPLNIEEIINNARPYISPNLTGEAVLTVGGTITEVASNACGAIAIGPFGCMPNRLSESILNVIMNRKGKLATDPTNKRLRKILTNIEDLPFLAIESDGSPFPQLINAKLETFCLRAERLHKRMLDA